MSSDIEITLFCETDAPEVRALFERVNRAFADAQTRQRFEDYIALAVREEIGRIADYYAPGTGSSFWVMREGAALVGMFGLERVDVDTVELRRMYVSPDHRRRGLARLMLARAEAIAREQGYRRMELSTSEIQGAALALYEGAGYVRERELVAGDASNKTVGGGIRRFYFTKML
jgi:putative acetyltransferase